MHGAVPRPTAWAFTTPSHHGDYAQPVRGAFLLWDTSSTQGRARVSVGLGLKTENGREEARRQKGTRLSIYTQMGRLFCAVISTCLLEKAGPFLEGHCL